jgi:UPF0755 protein
MLALLLLGACNLAADHYGAAAEPGNTEPIEITIPAGTSPRSLGAVLGEAGVIDSADDFTMYVRITKEGGCLKAGRFRLTRAMDAAAILETVCGVPLPDDVPFTIVEGWRIREIDAALVEKGWIQPGEYAAIAKNPAGLSAAFPLPEGSLEGYLFPETYMVIPDKWETKAFVQRQLDTLAERIYTPNKGAIAASGRDWSDIVILASMLEREEPTPKQRPLVAGIIWKRLDSGWNLGIDATSRYTLDEWNDRRAFLKKLRDPSDPYNTRLRQGLPPTAIGNAGTTAFEAAIAPVKSEYWYYLHDTKGVLHPGRNAAEHEALRRKYNVY